MPTYKNLQASQIVIGYNAETKKTLHMKGAGHPNSVITLSDEEAKLAGVKKLVQDKVIEIVTKPESEVKAELKSFSTEPKNDTHEPSVPDLSKGISGGDLDASKKEKLAQEKTEADKLAAKKDADAKDKADKETAAKEKSGKNSKK